MANAMLTPQEMYEAYQRQEDKARCETRGQINKINRMLIRTETLLKRTRLKQAVQV